MSEESRRRLFALMVEGRPRYIAGLEPYDELTPANLGRRKSPEAP
ncbi:MAG TPA: hypothetical protein VMF65_10675 [Acidimicrobiales bacterium]|nr:hypothetical protein [Acidimicrobiales bacterium]